MQKKKYFILTLIFLSILSLFYFNQKKAFMKMKFILMVLLITSTITFIKVMVTLEPSWIIFGMLLLKVIYSPGLATL